MFGALVTTLVSDSGGTQMLFQAASAVYSKAGIRLENPGRTGSPTYRWKGEYSLIGPARTGHQGFGFQNGQELVGSDTMQPLPNRPGRPEHAICGTIIQFAGDPPDINRLHGRISRPSSLATNPMEEGRGRNSAEALGQPSSKICHDLAISITTSRASVFVQARPPIRVGPPPE